MRLEKPKSPLLLFNLKHSMELGQPHSNSAAGHSVSSRLPFPVAKGGVSRHAARLETKTQQNLVAEGRVSQAETSSSVQYSGQQRSSQRLCPSSRGCAVRVERRLKSVRLASRRVLESSKKLVNVPLYLQLPLGHLWCGLFW